MADSPAMGCRSSPARRRTAARCSTSPASNHEGDRAARSTSGRRAARSRRCGRPRPTSRARCRCSSSGWATALLATIPGEMTVEMGRRMRAAVLAARRRGRAAAWSLAGYANEFVHYFVTPEEYEMQHYEGGSTLFGKYSSNLVMDDLATLARRPRARRARAGARRLRPAQRPRRPTCAPTTRAPRAATITAQPRRVAAPAARDVLVAGRPRGFDRPLDRRLRHDRARSAGGRWRRGHRRPRAGDPLAVDDDGLYTAQWQVRVAAPTRPLPLRGHRQPLQARLGAVPARRVDRAEARRAAGSPTRRPTCSPTSRSRPAFAARAFRTKRPGVRRDRYGNRTA